jgi:hypothetical protein
MSALGASLEISVEYRGPGEVNEEHRLFLFVFDAPDIGGAQPVALETSSVNGGKMVLDELPSSPLYLMALYDAQGGYAGDGPPAASSPVGIHTGKDGAPLAVEGGDAIRFHFDDSFRLIHLALRSDIPEDRLTSTKGILEIRMYKIKPGMRDGFVEFFEEKTLAPQADAGLRILGQFRSLADDDTFIWLRGFRNQAERMEQLAAFYGGPVWVETLGPEAMSFIESTEVLLVEPTGKSPLR